MLFIVWKSLLRLFDRPTSRFASMWSNWWAWMLQFGHKACMLFIRNMCFCFLVKSLVFIKTNVFHHLLKSNVRYTPKNMRLLRLNEREPKDTHSSMLIEKEPNHACHWFDPFCMWLLLLFMEAHSETHNNYNYVTCWQLLSTCFSSKVKFSLFSFLIP